MSAGCDYERSLGRDARKRAGVFYTPAYLVDYMVEQTIGRLLERGADPLTLRVCDPACGAGYFLSAAYRRLLDEVSRRGQPINEKLEAEIQRRCLFGADVDALAVGLAREQLPHANLAVTDSLSDRAVSSGGPFDVVLGNPPYGVHLAPEARRRLSARYGLAAIDTACLFMALSHELTASGGAHALIVPKPFLYSSKWDAIRRRLAPGLAAVVDCGAAWSDVKLEQAIYVHRKTPTARHYRSWAREGTRIRALGRIPRESIEEFGFLVSGVTEAELGLGRKLRNAGAFLGDCVINQRGAPLQRELRRSGRGFAAIGGRHLTRYAVDATGARFAPARAALDSRARVEHGSILVQNLVAHVRKPEDHLKIIGTIVPDPERFALLDTVNQLRNESAYPSAYLLGLLHSRMVAWYVYRFVVGKAVRTIHFDSPVTARIPLPASPAPKLVLELARLVHRRLDDPHRTRGFDDEIEEVVIRLYDLGKGWRELLGGIGVRG